ncbi:MAG: phospholipid carrier-dependent glycosyltransferase [Candidatus Shapirobacteria bacterium]
MSQNKLYFIIIFVVAAFFRFYQLGSLPMSLNWDEISHGYNAYSLIKTGHDQWGQSWPIFNFRAYGDYPTTLNLYLTIPFVYFLGLNAFSIRLPAAILSLAFAVLLYFVSRLLTKSRKLSLITFAIVAFSPWTFFPGRGVFQSNLAQFFLLLGIYCFILKSNKKIVWIISALSLGLSMYSYHNTRLVAPLIFGLLLYFYRPAKIKFIIISIIFLIFAIPNLINLASPQSLARNRWVGIINPNSINLINEKRRIFEGPQILNRVVNNKVVYFVQEVATNYVIFLSPIPIFFNGSQNYQFNLPNTPLIFIYFLPFFYIGLFYCFKHQRFLALSFLVTLIPAALTIGDYPSIRLTIATPFIYLFIVYGLKTISTKTKGFLLPSIIILTLLFFLNYWQKYQQYNINFAQSWQYGYEQVITELKTVYPSYNQIFFTKKYGEPHEFILFYWPWNPQKYLSDPNLNTDFHSDWYWVNAFDKFKFINDWEVKTTTIPKNSILVTSPNNYLPKNSKLLKTINLPNGTPVFDIVAYD